MPGQASQSNSGCSSSNNSQGTGQNTIIIDDEVSFSEPSTGLNGTPQQSGPSSGGNPQPTTPVRILTMLSWEWYREQTDQGKTSLLAMPLAGARTGMIGVILILPLATRYMDGKR